jgi:hypothetical protein
MGKLTNISEYLALQTLSKQLIIDKDGHLINPELVTKKLTVGNKRKRQDSLPENDIIDSSACGAFVHGLEDEFPSVRLATLGNISLYD